MKNEDTLYWLWLAEKCGIASKYFNRIIEKYGNPFDIYLLEDSEIEQLEGASKNLKDKLCEKNLNSCYDIIKLCKRESIDIISYADKRYPQALREMSDPPIVLYCKGHFPSLNSRLCVGIVGTRKMTEYGKQSAYNIAYELGAADVITVSGMALGIDGVAACGALAGGGTTIAVLGCGVDTVYPKAHKALMDEIIRHGAVISEYPPREAPHGYNFPKRNRIISGLSQGLLVIEASVGSGALITANEAIAQGREVFAVPGKITDAGAEGPNSLIMNGGFPVHSARDILKHYEFLYGDSYDTKRLERSRARLPLVREVLGKYGLLYAIDEKEELGRTFAAPYRAKKKKEESKELITAQESREPVSDSERCSDTLDKLDALTRRIYESIPIDRAVSADSVVGEGISTSDAITALTMLEIYGLISSLPGGMYIRK